MFAGPMTKLEWVMLMVICIETLAIVSLVAPAHGAELLVRHAKHAKVSVTMKRERGPAPVYVPPSPVPPIDRPAGVP